MKTLSITVLCCCLSLLSLAQNGISNSPSDLAFTQSLEVRVDGKPYAIITAAARNQEGNSIPINNLSAGSHVILLKPLTDPASTQATASPLVLPDIAGPLPGRANRVQQRIELTEEERDSIKIEFYDNGIVDQDTISVYKDDQPVMQKKMVSTEALRFFTSLPAGQKVQRIKMEAQNLGTIAPNTALMIVTTRKARYTIPLTGDLQTNAVVEFLIKE